MDYKPSRPVPRGTPHGFLSGRYKVEPEDFVVDEIPAYEPQKYGEHIYLQVEKRGLSTLDLLDEVARLLKVHPRSIGVAGLKDKQAISRQWISVHGVDEAAARSLSGQGWRVVQASRHGNKLQMGHLRGNRFSITLRGTKPGDAEVAAAALAELERQGVPNYFGEQRFGKRGANLQRGLEILGGGAARLSRSMPRRVFGLCIAAVQSEIFNRVVMARLSGLGALLAGDLAILHRNHACFPIEDPAKEQARADAFELSPSGPMHGPKMPDPIGEPKRIEDEAMAAIGVAREQFVNLPFGFGAGERRPLRMPVADAAAAPAAPDAVTVSFSLPRGCFATSVLRELLTETVWFADE
jgi:tRNA pseudouridine13 synthase